MVLLPELTSAMIRGIGGIEAEPTPLDLGNEKLLFMGIRSLQYATLMTDHTYIRILIHIREGYWVQPLDVETMRKYWLSTHLIHLPPYSHRIKVEVGPEPKNTLTYPSCMVFNSVTELRASARIGRDTILVSFITGLLSMPVLKAQEGFKVEDYVKRSSQSSIEGQQCKSSALSKRFEVRIIGFTYCYLFHTTASSPNPTYFLQ